jgi:hypothetical protein
MCTVKEERGAAGAEVALRREIVLGKREVDGGDLEQLPELFNRLGAATRVVVGVGGGR